MKKNFLCVAMGLFVLIGGFGCSETENAGEEALQTPDKVMYADTEKSAAEVPSEEAKDVAEVMPEFPGGMKALLSFLGENLKYPAESVEKSEQGRVVCKFVVAKDGGIKDVQVVRSVSAALDNEAIRIIQSMPKWKPGSDKGKPVDVKYTLPIQFKLK